MKKVTQFSVAAAALSGLLLGTAARASAAPVAASEATQTVKKSAVDAGQKAVKLDDTTKGKHDCKGKNDCKGQGGCKTANNDCKGKNTCKGKGGCSTAEKPAEKPKTA